MKFRSSLCRFFHHHAPNNAYTVCIKRETQRSFCLYKKSPLLIPLMSRICKLWADVKREFSDLGENYLAGEGRHLDSRFRGNDNWWGKLHPTKLDSHSFDSFDKTPTFAEASQGRRGRTKHKGNIEYRARNVEL